MLQVSLSFSIICSNLWSTRIRAYYRVFSTRYCVVMAEDNNPSAAKRKRSSVQYSFNIELSRNPENESRVLGIKDRVAMARKALNLSKSTSSTQNADLMEALLLAFEEKMDSRSTSLSLQSTPMATSTSSSFSAQPFPIPVATSTPRSRTSLPFTDPVSPISLPQPEDFSPRRRQITTPASEQDPIYLCSEGALRALFSFFADSLLAKCCYCGKRFRNSKLAP